MLDSFKAQLALPTSAYTKASTVDMKLKGNSLSSGVYLLESANLPTGIAQLQHTVGITRRAPGQRGSNRGQILTQATLLDVNGGVHIISFNTTLTVTNFFVPPVGVAVDVKDTAKTVAAINLGYTLNPLDSTSTGSQALVLDSMLDGLIY